MRELTNVVYELNLINKEGTEITETFSHTFDSELYNHDVDGTDVMMVNFKMQDLMKEHGKDIFLLEFTIDRGGMVQ
jgi:hypothetical protein